MIHSEIRDLQIELVRQRYTQTNELKNHIQTVLEDSQFREKELMQENIRLRDELIRLQNINNDLQKKLKQFKA
ncbi:hypothetical protein MXB_2891 [Myxobolus squamalis]|nr:hypothetical protein MXB_2891 [Myxobolus squamalis]